LRRDPWRAATPSQTDSQRRKTLSVSPEDDLRPPASKTLSVSPYEGENFFPEVGRNPGPCVSPPKAFGGEQEGSCDAGSLRFPHRVTDPRFAAEHRAPAGLHHNPWSHHNPWFPPTILQESKNTGKQDPTRTDDPRPPRGAEAVPERGAHRRRMHGSECRVVRRFSSPFWPVKKVHPSARAGRTSVRNESLSRIRQGWDVELLACECHACECRACECRACECRACERLQPTRPHTAFVIATDLFSHSCSNDASIHEPPSGAFRHLKHGTHLFHAFSTPLLRASSP